ncbi:MAG: hypothetical protein AAF488_17720 [Planctomycetota bacterium]
MVQRIVEQLPDTDYERHPAFRDQLRSLSSSERIAALEQFLPLFHRNLESHIRYLDEFPPLKDEDAAALQSEVARRIHDDGALSLAITDEEKHGLGRILAPTLDQLAKDRKAVPDSKRKFKHNAVGLKPHKVPELTSATEAILRRTGALAGIEELLCAPVRIKRFAALIHDETDQYHRNKFEEFGLPDPPTNGMHLDSPLDGPPVKALIYLSHVEPENGPFGYVLGTHRVSDTFDLCVRKTTDMLKMSRESFLALPREFRRKLNFGVDLLDGESEAAAVLLEREHQFLSSGGDLLLFDFNGVHRGGMVERGSRTTLQVVFETKDDGDA